MSTKYDVIIIGSGAGGGTLAGIWRRQVRVSSCSNGAIG
jgi:pyruvate/2-oxoglutarate dehydrogenase complex dihydrolipoamide dehydrogenase (E3) component